MKSIEYKVIYENGNEEYFYCLSFNQCIATAMYYAYDKGWDVRLKYITDGKTTIKNIVIGYEFS
jgi:hypothetical protein